jgi:hypothetical protein
LYRVEKIKWLKGEGLGRILLFGVPIRISWRRGRNRVAKECFAGLEPFIMPRRWYHVSYYIVKGDLWRNFLAALGTKTNSKLEI